MRNGVVTVTMDVITVQNLKTSPTSNHLLATELLCKLDEVEECAQIAPHRSLLCHTMGGTPAQGPHPLDSLAQRDIFLVFPNLKNPLRRKQSAIFAQYTV